MRSTSVRQLLDREPAEIGRRVNTLAGSRLAKNEPEPKPCDLARSMRK